MKSKKCFVIVPLVFANVRKYAKSLVGFGVPTNSHSHHKETTMEDQLGRTGLAWILFFALLSLCAVYGGAQEVERTTPHRRYTLIDLGTLGGRQSYLNFSAHVLEHIFWEPLYDNKVTKCGSFPRSL